MLGYWINIDTGKYEEIFEHADWIQDTDNQKLIGLNLEIGDKISKLSPTDYKGKQREEIVTLAMQGGLIRVRRYGTGISFEFLLRGRNSEIINTINNFLTSTDIAGDYTQLTINNLATNESIGMLYKEFKDRVKRVDIESILRIAKKVTRR